MDFLTLARKRRSMRGFLPTPVPPEMVTALLQAAVAAPSGGNRQPWHFYVVQNPAYLQRIHERSYRSAWFASAPMVIVVCVEAQRSREAYGERGGGLYCLQDTAAAVQNILLCAQDLGLGACWCGAFDESAMAEILELPDSRRPVALIPLGYAAKQASGDPSRRPLEEVVTYL